MKVYVLGQRGGHVLNFTSGSSRIDDPRRHFCCARFLGPADYFIHAPPQLIAGDDFATIKFR
jgi:hypothetical protein